MTSFAMLVSTTILQAQTIVVDQYQLICDDQNRAIHSNVANGQTFTAATCGMLATVEVPVFQSASPTATLRMQIVDASGSLSNPPLLGEVSLAPSQITTSLPPSPMQLGSVTGTVFDVSSLNIEVNPGDMLGFVLRSSAVLPSLYAVRSEIFTNRYAGGVLLTGGSTLQTVPGGDLGFKVSVNLGGSVVDQYQLICDDQNRAIHSNVSNGQTFTVATRGTLAAVEVPVFQSASPTATLRMQIVDASGSLSNPPVLGEVSLAPSQVTTSLPPSPMQLGSVTGTVFDVSSLCLRVQPGDMLGFVLRSSAVLPSLYAVRSEIFTNRYAGGVLLTGGSTLQTVPGGDLGFKVLVDTPGPSGSCTFRNGTGINPADYTCTTNPVLGTTWMSSIVMNPTTISTWLGLAATSSQIPFLGGEILIGLAPPPIFLSGTGTYSVPIPNTSILLNTSIFAQGFRVDAPGGVPTFVMLNAQDLLLGV